MLDGLNLRYTLREDETIFEFMLCATPFKKQNNKCLLTCFGKMLSYYINCTQYIYYE
jgi:hypothetical protein